MFLLIFFLLFPYTFSNTIFEIDRDFQKKISLGKGKY